MIWWFHFIGHYFYLILDRRFVIDDNFERLRWISISNILIIILKPCLDVQKSNTNVADVKTSLLTVAGCWLLNFNVGDIFWMLKPKKIVDVSDQNDQNRYILKLPPTHFVSNIRHQHRCNR